MSGRRVRRPPAAAAPDRGLSQNGQSRRVRLRVMAAAAAILLAGAAVTFLLEQAVLAPRRQVRTEAALPVYSAVGQRTDDVSFWPWTFYAEHAAQAPAQFPLEDYAYMSEALVRLSDALLGGGGVELESAAAVSSYYDERCACGYLRELPVRWTPPEGGEARRLTLNAGFGGGDDPALAFGTAMSFVLKAADQPPTEAQLEAAYRQVLLELYLLCGAADSGQADAADASRPPAEGQRAARTSPAQVMDRLFGPLVELTGINGDLLLWPSGLEPDPALWPPEDFLDPAALALGTLSEAELHSLEQRLQQQYAAYGMELQVVTLTDSVLVLISSKLTLGLYFDPVLGAWSGVAFQ